MRKFGLIGYPLSHSFSQWYFAQKFEREKIFDASYDNYAIPEIKQIEEIIKLNPEIVGLNVTIPHKRSVISLLNDVSKLPVDACNCVRVENGHLTGYNTDIVGFEKSLLPGLRPYHSEALILGNGGASLAVKFVLDKLKLHYQIVSRRPSGDGQLTYDLLSKKIMQESLLIINTTPVGMFPLSEEAPGIPYEFLGDHHYLFDLVYNPRETVFLRKAKEKGAAVKNGYDMLVIQAEESWKIWNTTPT